MDVPQKQRAGKTKTETQEAVNTADMGKAKPRPCNKTTDTGHGYIRGGRVKRTGSAKLHKDEVVLPVSVVKKITQTNDKINVYYRNYYKNMKSKE